MVISPRDVTYIFTAHISKPGHKFFAVCCTEPMVLGFLINSRIRPYIKKRPWLHDSQVRITRAEHTFLSHDSYLDCTEPHTFDLEYLELCVSKNPEALPGQLSDDAVKQVLDVVATSDTIPPNQIDWILTGLAANLRLP